MAFELGQVEIRTGAGLEEPTGAVEEVEPEVEEARGYRLSVHENVLLPQMPTAGPDDEDGRLVVQAVRLVGRLELDRPVDRLHQVRLALDAVRPCWRVRILEVRHEAARAGIERVDQHLALDGAGDL